MMWQWLRRWQKVPGNLGAWGEQLARAEYRKLGFEILAANFFNRRGKQMGEIDFIAKTKSVIAFVEVKTRSAAVGKFGSGAEAVNFFKQQKLLKAAKFFLQQHQEFAELSPRIDVCVITAGLDKTAPDVKIITNAVEETTDLR